MSDDGSVCCCCPNDCPDKERCGHCVCLPNAWSAAVDDDRFEGDPNEDMTKHNTCAWAAPNVKLGYSGGTWTIEYDRFDPETLTIDVISISMPDESFDCCGTNTFSGPFGDVVVGPAT
jgi:hypothetical protein